MLKDIKKRIAVSKLWNNIFLITGLLSTLVGLVLLFTLFVDLFIDGVPRLSYKFFASFPSRFPEQAGILSAWVGTSLVMLVTAAAAIPLGVAAGIYLEEYGRKNWVTSIIEINITNLAGVPSIIYGLLALGLFVYLFKFGESILTGGLALALLILPMIIMATREAIRAIPNSIREASYALGATKWQTVKNHIIPYSMGGILTGIIIGLSRAIGETAPIITVGALTFIAFLPVSPFTSEFPFISFKWLFDPFTVMPIQMFNWVSRPQAGFQVNAAAAGIVLLIMTLIMNAVAIYIRYKFRKKIKW
ncbi:MAG: phosphate ABC transporter, permease protein PstA [Nitrospirae bacterium GWC2_46_6]|nr:MAG: phosphate ABC transporter, permease protein PstA [Nitrospirae bacterium GWC2_46_6]OGW22032.1 MAG: phosphate ABC transporter, permease protein PstA [Nitrospirae bacterium GWA2_46_11]OGW25787.1 MAG: phosphate ABC transporter, permease protein PstA [Nitrospirae bacterium GWB2_47_37]HAK89551.1 phosphate ABC transporter permease PtsA [Nitrospiraceae bacterium]